MAHGRTIEQISDHIGADWLIYQEIDDLVECSREGNSLVDGFELSVFDGQYQTGVIDDAYLTGLVMLAPITRLIALMGPLLAFITGVNQCQTSG